jgi:hypothetical protein
VVLNGISHILEASLYDGTSSQQVYDKVSNSTWTLNNFSFGSVGGLTTLNSNAGSDGAGSSHILVNRNLSLETGSITFQIWFNLKNVPINVGGNNNWRAMLPDAADPLRIVLEQNLGLNFTTVHTDGTTRRHITNSFTPVFADANGWQFITYTYSQATGEASVYKNEELIRVGAMTESGGANPTTPGLGLRYNNYISNGFRIYGGTNTASNPNGGGVCPGEVGNIMFYNRALSAAEVQQNYNALKGRFQ